MSQAAEDWSYSIQAVTKDDVEQIGVLLKKTFYVDEPMNEALQLWNENQPCEELDEYCFNALLKGYSFKAVDKQGNIVGAMICSVCSISENLDCADCLELLRASEGTLSRWSQLNLQSLALNNPHWARVVGLGPIFQQLDINRLMMRGLRLPSGLRKNAEETMLKEAEQCKNPKFQRILYILAKREEGAKLWQKYPQDKEMVEVLVAATDPKWRRRGIMNKLVAETEKLLKERKIRILRLDTSSAYSAMSAERMGFTCVYRAFYKDLKRDGEPLVVPKEPHVEDCVYIKELYN